MYINFYILVFFFITKNMINILTLYFRTVDKSLV